MKPRYKHDCTRCRLIAVDQMADWYHCAGILGGSIIGRTGDEGHEYWSSPCDVIAGARVLADSNGFHARAKQLLADLTP